ncbi:MAG: STAS domain-containing protein [Pirellulales bacterium]
MNLPSEIFGDVIVVHAPDDLGTDQASGLESHLTTLEPKQVVLDMDATESLDSAALAALVESQENLRELGGDLKIATTNSVNRKILELTRLDQQLEVFENVIDAVKSFRALPD